MKKNLERVYEERIRCHTNVNPVFLVMSHLCYARGCKGAPDLVVEVISPSTVRRI